MLGREDVEYEGYRNYCIGIDEGCIPDIYDFHDSEIDNIIAKYEEVMRCTYK